MQEYTENGRLYANRSLLTLAGRYRRIPVRTCNTHNHCCPPPTPVPFCSRSAGTAKRQKDVFSEGEPRWSYKSNFRFSTNIFVCTCNLISPCLFCLCMGKKKHTHTHTHTHRQKGGRYSCNRKNLFHSIRERMLYARISHRP
jgi:hypothetical protein